MKAFIDSQILIYGLSAASAYALDTADLIVRLRRANVRLVTSNICLAEVLVGAYLANDRERAARWDAQIRSSFRIVSFADACVHPFGYVRSADPSIKGLDAANLACALADDCDRFITHDLRLARKGPLLGLETISLADARIAAWLP